jgi:hypothetical protein
MELEKNLRFSKGYELKNLRCMVNCDAIKNSDPFPECKFG